MPERELIQGCINNDRKAQFALYQKYFAFVSGICLRYLRSEGIARETTNDIFLKVFTKISLFDGGKGSFMAWLKKVAVNTCIDKLKLKTADLFSLSTAEDIAETNFATDNLDTEELLNMMKQLPERQSAILNLYIVEGYNHEEIGVLLGISAGNSRWYLNDAKQRLKKLLTSTGYMV